MMRPGIRNASEHDCQVVNALRRYQKTEPWTRQRVYSLWLSMPRESRYMTTHAITPHTRIDNSIIDDLASQIGIYGLGIYVAIKRHLNQKTGDCYPSYQTIARKLGIDRSTVIRYVKKLKALNLLSPLLRFKEDGSPTSNQYNFDKGSGTKQPEAVAQNNQPSGSALPEQSENNKKQRTISDVDFFR